MRWMIAAGAALAGLLVAAPSARAEEGWTWPVRGRVLTAYVNDNAQPYAGGMHRGIDIAAAAGTEVLAARAGTVVFAGPLGSAGNVVSVRADDARHVTSYLHLAVVSVGRGTPVALGARVGEVGTTGRRSLAEPHLHFGVRLADVEDRYVDPLSLLPPLGGAEAAPAAPVPVPAAAPVRVQEAPAAVRVRAPAAARAPAVARRAPVAAPRGTVLPGPAVAPAWAARPTAAPVASKVERPDRALRPVAAGPVSQRTAGQVRHPRAAALGSEAPQASRDRGRPLVWAGVGLVAVVLFGGALVRANAALNRRAAALMSRPQRLMLSGPDRTPGKVVILCRSRSHF